MVFVTFLLPVGRSSAFLKQAPCIIFTIFSSQSYLQGSKSICQKLKKKDWNKRKNSKTRLSNKIFEWKQFKMFKNSGCQHHLALTRQGFFVGRLPSDGDWHCSVQFSRSVVSDSLRPHESQHTRPPCPSPTLGVHSDSHPLSQWCHPAISFSVIPFSSCLQSLPASESFPMSQLFAWGGQSTGVSASASFPPKKSQGWSYHKYFKYFGNLYLNIICFLCVHMFFLEHLQTLFWQMAHRLQ